MLSFSCFKHKPFSVFHIFNLFLIPHLSFSILAQSYTDKTPQIDVYGQASLTDYKMRKKLPYRGKFLLDEIGATDVSTEFVDTFICVVDADPLFVAHPTFALRDPERIQILGETFRPEKAQKYTYSYSLRGTGDLYNESNIDYNSGHGTGMAALIIGQSQTCEDKKSQHAQSCQAQEFKGLLADAKVKLRYVNQAGLSPAEALQKCRDEEGEYPQVISISMAWQEKQLAEELGKINPYQSKKENLEEVLRDFQEHNTLIVSSLGINKPAALGSSLYQRYYPAAAKDVLSVGGINASHFPILSSLINYALASEAGDQVDLVAPGQDVLRPGNQGVVSRYTSNGRERLSGTYIADLGASPATAIVAASAAWVMSYAPECTADQVQQALKQSATFLNYIGTGQGKIHVRKAIEWLQEQCPSDQNPVLHPLTDKQKIEYQDNPEFQVPKYDSDHIDKKLEVGMLSQENIDAEQIRSIREIKIHQRAHQHSHTEDELYHVEQDTQQSFATTFLKHHVIPHGAFSSVSLSSQDSRYHQINIEIHEGTQFVKFKPTGSIKKIHMMMKKKFDKDPKALKQYSSKKSQIELALHGKPRTLSLMVYLEAGQKAQLEITSLNKSRKPVVYPSYYE
tara:strand:- start:16763 stop:18634 length:1872 start_codon:yes stop_codon:yes gene_type:complete